MNERIHVWRDAYGKYEHVGLIEAERLADVMRRGMRLRADFAFDEDSRETIA